MKIRDRIASWFTSGRRKAASLDARLDAALASKDKAHEVVKQIVASARTEVAEAKSLSEKTRERLVLLEARHQQRRHDPHLSVITDTMRIMENRSR